MVGFQVRVPVSMAPCSFSDAKKDPNVEKDLLPHVHQLRRDELTICCIMQPNSQTTNYLNAPNQHYG